MNQQNVSVETGRGMTLDFFARHDAKIVPVSESGCWIWIGAATPKGYGLCQMGERTKHGRLMPSFAHRAAYAASGKSISPATVVRHSCDVRCCVNPEHLIAGTYLDNSQDMVRRGRSLKGTRQPNSILTEADVAEIVRRHRGGETIAAISKDFPVHVETVRKAAKRATWRHVK
jgi:hypothetical protein